MALFLIALATLGADTTASHNWPGFLADGTNRTSAQALPMHWSPDEGVAWEVKIPGYGQSSPVVWRSRVFVTSIDGDNKERCLVYAFDLKTGEKLWTSEFAASQKTKYGYMVSRAAPTPAVDGNGLYVFFESGDVAKFSHDGEKQWNRSLVKEYGEFQSNHGIGSSLAQTDNSLVILAAHDGPSYLLSIDKASGKTLWKAQRESRVSWTSPIAAKVDDKTQIVVSSNGSVQGYDAADGSVLWTLDGISGNTIPSASFSGDRVLIGAGVGRRNPDEALAARSNCCLQLKERDGEPGYDVAWSATKATSSYATPLAHRGCAYFVNKVGVVYCLDLATGKQHYAKRIDGACWASPLGVGDHVYFFTKKGVTTVIKAGPKFEKVASNQLWNEEATPTDTEQPASESAAGEATSRQPSSGYLDPIVYGVAAVDGSFVVRTGQQLYCVSNTSENDAPKVGTGSATGKKSALLIVAHGSRNKDWCERVSALETEVTQALADRGDHPFAKVKVAFMENADPSIRAAVDEIADAGIREIYAVPLFTCESGHVVHDIPGALGLYRNPYAEEEDIEKVARTDVHITLGPPLSHGGFLREAMLHRVKEISKDPATEAVVLLAHGSEQYDSVWRSVCQDIGSFIKEKAGISHFDYAFVQVGQRFESHGVPAIEKALQQRDRVLVVGLYMSLGVKARMADKLPVSLRDKQIVFSEKGVLPSTLAARWIADTAVGMVSAE